VDYRSGERVVKYLCPGCQEIVSVDLQVDEVCSTSSSGSYRSLETQRTVLIADDAATTREVAAELLREAGFRVVLAVDGAAALRAMREDPPDLVLLDLLMPTMTGFDVLREMREDERLRELPVLVVSSVYRDNVKGFLHELGARDFLDKGRLRDDLVARTRSLLGVAAQT